MLQNRSISWALMGVFSLVLVACSDPNNPGEETTPAQPTEAAERETIWDLFNQPDRSTSLQVNRYIWTATLEVMDFMPVLNADPFGGVIEYGWGTVPGGNLEYSASVFIGDPALDARSLRVTLRTRTGVVDPDTTREIENAILTRARQIRIRELEF